MALQQHELQALQAYLPANTAGWVIDYMHSYKIHLKIKRERRTILGDYRPAHRGKPHTISVNANLNSYHFLITFLHELAHLINHLNMGHRALPHGAEWKAVFSNLLKKFLDAEVFPKDIAFAIIKSLQSPSASTCSDPYLYKILRKYDHETEKLLIDELNLGDHFKTDKNQEFKLLEKRRTRFVCEDLTSGKKYLFPGIYEVYKL